MNIKCLFYIYKCFSNCGLRPTGGGLQSHVTLAQDKPPGCQNAFWKKEASSRLQQASDPLLYTEFSSPQKGSQKLPKGSQKASLLTKLPVWLEATSSLFCGPIECVSTPAHPRRGNWGILKAFQHRQDHCVATHHGKQCATMPKRLGTTVLYY